MKTNPDLEKMLNEILVPPHGVVQSEGYPKPKDRNVDFSFDYEFDKHEVSDLAGLFGISQNEASDCIAEEVLKRWPGKTGMSDFPGGTSYGQRTGDRIETFREHIQRHALNHAATTLLQTRPTVCSRYGWDSGDPWGVFLRERDVSFEDGSWLSDHKDEVPDQALEYLLGERNGSQETLQEKALLLRKIGLTQLGDARFIPIYGHWTTPDGVHVRITSALTARRGAVGRCANFSKNADHEMWLPMYGSDGRADRFREKGPFEPLIWEPESYPIGIDNSDELAASGVIARPRLGRAINTVLGLRPDKELRQWSDQKGEVVLKNVVWGEWTSSDHDYRQKSQDEGAILWASRSRLDEVLDTCRSSLVYLLNFSKYKSSRSYDDSSGVRQVYVALKRGNEEPRFWFAKKASETVY